MLSSLLCWAAIVLYIPMSYILVGIYLPCLAHCINYDSWEECKYPGVFDHLTPAALYGCSGYLFIFGNCREYHILYHWLLVTAEIIGFNLTFYVYAHKFVNYPLWEWPVIFPCFLVSSFVVVILHILLAKNIIRNRWIRKILLVFLYPSGKVGY